MKLDMSNIPRLLETPQLRGHSATEFAGQLNIEFPEEYHSHLYFISAYYLTLLEYETPEAWYKEIEHETDQA